MAQELLRIEVPVRADRREPVSAGLWQLGAVGVWEQPRLTIAWFPPELGDPLRSDLGIAELTDPAIVQRTEPDHDWQAAWKATIAPIRAGRILVVPTWLAAEHADADNGDGDNLTIVLDAGQAFGSGHHATTWLCLELLDDLDRSDGLAGRTVADIGCGSGILAIAAAARGAIVTAIDIDPDAVEVTRANAAANRVELHAEIGSVQATPAGTEVVVANLISDVVRELAPELVAMTGRFLIVSGISEERREDVLACLVAEGAEVVQVRSRDGWIAAQLEVAPTPPPEPLVATGERTPAPTEPSGSNTTPTEPSGSSVRTRVRRDGGRHPTTRSMAGFVMAGLLATGLLAAGCTEPEVPDTVAEEAAVDEPVELDAENQALATELEQARRLVDDIDADLRVAAAATDLEQLRAAATSADLRLVADGGGGQAALFPGEPAERTEGRSDDDALTALLTLARELGGPLGRAVIETLRDPIAGDLGAWELDAPGVVGNARAATAGATSTEVAGDMVLALDGEGPRAIAWVALAIATDDLDLGRAAAQRATDHLEVIDIALGSVQERTAGTAGAAGTAGTAGTAGAAAARLGSRGAT